MGQEVLFILDQVLLNFSSIKNEGIRDALQAVFLAIERRFNATGGDVPGLRSRLPQLVSLYSMQQNWTLLEGLIARAVDSTSIAWIDGVPPAGDSNLSAVESLVLTSCSRWSKRLEFKSEGLDVSIFLKRPEWTPYTVSIIKSLIYTSETARRITRTFLGSRVSLNQPALHLAPVLWSWLDASDISDIGLSGTWKKHFDKLTASILDAQAPQNHRLTCRRAIHAIVLKLPSLRAELFSNLLACVKGMPPDALTAEMLQLGKQLIEVLPKESDTFAYSLLEHAIACVSRSFAGPEILDDRVVRALSAMPLARSIAVC